jgi:hypothetical protein
MGRLYAQINKRVEEVEQERSKQGPATGRSNDTDALSGSSSGDVPIIGPTRRSSRRTRSKR